MTMALAFDNRRKAATLLVAVGPERAAALMQGLDEDEVRELAAEVSHIGELPREAVAEILQEVAEEVVSRRMAAAGGMRYAHDLLSRTLGDERAARLMEVIEGERRGVPFHYLASAPADLVARALTGESPASAALALAHLPAESAAKVLARMSPTGAAELARRLAALEQAHPEVIAEVNADFEARLAPLLETHTQEIPGLARLVDMLNLASRDTERELLQGIEATDPELAARIREALFVFDDVARLDDRAIQQVLKGIDSKDLATALKGAGDAVTEAIMRNLSERARTNLQEEIEFLKNVRATDISEARSRIVKQVRTLEEDGTIVIERGGGDDGGI
jgi:flagellar motor switch protein FliG